MTFFRRNDANTAWVETFERIHTGTGWTADTDELRMHDGSQFELIQPDPAKAGPLRAPVGVTVDDVTASSVEISWTNPTQPFLEPTDVQMRIPDVQGDIWTESTYPIDGYAHAALDFGTEYQFQVRYVRRVDGIIIATSAATSVFFTTDAAGIGAPAPDPGGTDGDSIFPVFPLPGGGAVDSSDCWWAWELFIISLDTLDWITTGLTGEYDGTATEFPYDLDTLDPTRTYRIEQEEICNGVPSGNVSVSPPFVGLADWGAACGEIPASSSAAATVVADAIWQMPEMCTTDDGHAQGLFERVSGVQLAEGQAFRVAYQDADGEWGVLADDVGGTVFTAGLPAVATTFDGGQDFTTYFEIFMPSTLAADPPLGARATKVIGLTHVLQIVYGASSWKAKVAFYTTSGPLNLESQDVSYDTAWHAITLRWNDDGGKALVVDGEISIDEDADPLMTGGVVTSSYVVGLPAGCATRKHYAWDRLVDDGDLLEIGSSPLTTEWVVVSSGSGGWGFDDVNMTLAANDWLIGITNKRWDFLDDAAVATEPAAVGGGVAWVHHSTIGTAGHYDTAGLSDGGAGVWLGRPDGAGNFEVANQGSSMVVVGRLRGARGPKVQHAQATGTTDVVACDLSTAPAGPVIVIVAHGGFSTNNGFDLQPAAPSGWRKVFDADASPVYQKGVTVFTGLGQSFDWTMDTQTSLGGGWACWMIELEEAPIVDLDLINLVDWHIAFYAKAVGGSDGDEIFVFPDMIAAQDMTTSNGPEIQDGDPIWNGQRVLRWNSDEDRGIELATTPADGPIAQPFSVVAIGRFDDMTASGSGTGPCLFDGGHPNNECRLRIRQPTAGDYRFAVMVGGTEVFTAVADTDPHLFAIVANGASSKFLVDGVVVATGNFGAEQWDGLMAGYSQAGSTTNWRLDGELAFLAMVEGDITGDPGWTAFKAKAQEVYGFPIA